MGRLDGDSSNGQLALDFWSLDSSLWAASSEHRSSGCVLVGVGALRRCQLDVGSAYPMYLMY